MPNLRITEIKAFVPAKDFEISKQFYKDLGFTMASEGGGVAYFHFEHVSFLLQDFCAASLAENFMMHILVEDVEAWWTHVLASGVASKYGVRVTDIESQPWRMRDFWERKTGTFYISGERKGSDPLLSKIICSFVFPLHEYCV